MLRDGQQLPGATMPVNRLHDDLYSVVHNHANVLRSPIHHSPDDTARGVLFLELRCSRTFHSSSMLDAADDAERVILNDAA